MKEQNASLEEQYLVYLAGIFHDSLEDIHFSAKLMHFITPEEEQAFVETKRMMIERLIKEVDRQLKNILKNKHNNTTYKEGKLLRIVKHLTIEDGAEYKNYPKNSLERRIAKGKYLGKNLKTLGVKEPLALVVKIFDRKNNVNDIIEELENGHDKESRKSKLFETYIILNKIRIAQKDSNEKDNSIINNALKLLEGRIESVKGFIQQIQIKRAFQLRKKWFGDGTSRFEKIREEYRSLKQNDSIKEKDHQNNLVSILKGVLSNLKATEEDNNSYEETLTNPNIEYNAENVLKFKSELIKYTIKIEFGEDVLQKIEEE